MYGGSLPLGRDFRFPAATMISYCIIAMIEAGEKMKYLQCFTLLALAVAAGCSQPSAPASGTPPASEAPGAVKPAAEAPAQPAGQPAADTPVATPPLQAPGNPVARPAAQPSRPRTLTVAAGTPLRVRTTNTLSTKTAEAGERFTATLVEPLVEGNTVIAPKGATVEGKIVNADPGGKVKGVAQIAVALTSLHTTSGIVAISTSSVGRQAATSKKKDAAKIGIGAGIGAAIGAIAGGGKGAAIGSAAGAGAGTGMVLGTKGEPAVIPAESLLTFKLREPVVVSLGR
jgi:hypothetical protein